MTRRCKVCNTPLASYNKKDTCYAHTPGMIIFEYHPVTKATPMLKDGKREGNGRTAPGFPEPGDEGYLDAAFERVSVGKINKNHEFVEFGKGEV